MWHLPDTATHNAPWAKISTRSSSPEGPFTPTFRMDESITDFYAFTKDSFSMENYQFHPFNFEIPMAI